MVVTQDELPEGSSTVACVTLFASSHVLTCSFELQIKPVMEALHDKDKAARTQWLRTNASN